MIERSCANCDHSPAVEASATRVPMGGADIVDGILIYCREDSPKLVTRYSGGSQSARIPIETIRQWPTVRPEHRCGRFTPKVDTV